MSVTRRKRGTTALDNATIIDADVTGLRLGGVDVQAQADAVASGAIAHLAPKVLKIRIEAPEDGTAQDTEVEIPAGSVVIGAFLDVVTKEDTGTTKTIDVGLVGGSGSAFLDDASVATEAIVAGTAVRVAINAATKVSFTAASADFEEMVADIYILFVQVT